MAIRIMHVVEAVGVGGGVENGIANLIARMDATRYEHVLCAVALVGPHTERYPAARVRIVSLNQRPRRFQSQVAPLARVIRELQPDVVHSRNWGALEAVFAARWAGTGMAIHSEHGLEMTPAAEPRRRRWLRRAAFEAAHRVFAVSSGLRDTLARSTGFPCWKFGVIHNGVDTRRFRPDGEMRRLFRAEFGIGEDEFCIGSVGRLDPIKDYPTVLRALERFSGACSSWRLLIAGEGTERAALQAQAAQSGALHGRVLFLGAWQRIPELLSAVDTYVLSSTFEGLSNSLLEAMASGAAVLATRTGGNPELVVEEESGLLFPVGDATALADGLTRLFLSEEERHRLAAAAVSRIAREFSLDSMLDQYEALYAQPPCPWQRRGTQPAIRRSEV
jgi:sugar transferase (PEP-CTERM/EpsH1 system associated)